MQLTFLGTGTSQGVPVIACNCEVCNSLNSKDKRLRTSVLINTQQTTICIDTGPDFRTQMLREHVQQLDAVVFTHEHKDHVAGLDDVRAFNFKQQKDMPLFATPRVCEALRNEFHYAFAKHPYPGIPRLELHEISNQPFKVNDLELTPIEVMHHKLKVMGYRIGKLTYITDANYISPEEKEKIKGSEILIINALRKTQHISHFTLEQAIELSKELNVQTTYLTHLSHLMGKHDKLSEELPQGVYVAYDGLTIEF